MHCLVNCEFVSVRLCEVDDLTILALLGWFLPLFALRLDLTLVGGGGGG